MRKKGAAFIDFVIWIALALGVALLIFLIYLVLTGKLEGVIEAIKNIFRFGASAGGGGW